MYFLFTLSLFCTETYYRRHGSRALHLVCTFYHHGSSRHKTIFSNKPRNVSSSIAFGVGEFVFLND